MSSMMLPTMSRVIPQNETIAVERFQTTISKPICKTVSSSHAHARPSCKCYINALSMHDPCTEHARTHIKASGFRFGEPV